MENFTLQLIIHELQNRLLPQRLGRIYQLGVTDLALEWQGRDGRYLRLSTDPQRLALYLTRRDVRKESPPPRTDTPFAALLKKYLSGAQVVALDKLGYDRVVRLDFVATQGEDRTTVTSRPAITHSLIIELTGRSANVYLLAGETVLATLRERNDCSEKYSEPAPPADKLDPFDCTEAGLTALLNEYHGDVLKAARARLLGFDLLFARELAWRARDGNLHAGLQSLLGEVFAQPPQPRIYSAMPLTQLQHQPGHSDFSLTLAGVPLWHLADQVQTDFPTLNEAADKYFSLLDDRRRFMFRRQQLASALSTRLKRQRSLVTSLRREEATYQNAEQHQRYGDLLLAGLHQADKTDGGFRVTDYYDPAQPLIEIPAAGRSDAKEAAAHYFKLARKARHGLEVISKRLPSVESEIAALDAALRALNTIISPADLAAMTTRYQSLSASPGKPSVTQPGKKTKDERITGVRRYRSSDGYEILVGRSSSDNDQLTFRIAKSFDLWFHAADYPGSHVVLRNPQRKAVPARAITEAAQLAAKFSHAKNATKVAVHYCERKFVTKPKGFAPGQVRLSSFKTVMVEPQEAGERLM